MSIDEMHRAVTSVLIDTNEEEDEINALILHTLEMNEVDLKNIFTKHVIKKGLFNTVTKLVYPFLKQVGVLWGTNKIMPAQEHFISNLITIFIMLAIKKFILDEDKIHAQIQENKKKPKKENKFQRKMREMMDQAEAQKKKK